VKNKQLPQHSEKQTVKPNAENNTKKSEIQKIEISKKDF
jgi:hypothetical protein